jgi:hypothetical protein
MIRTAYCIFRLTRHIAMGLENLQTVKHEHLFLHNKYSKMAADYEDRAHETFTAVSSTPDVILSDHYVNQVEQLYRDVCLLYDNYRQLEKAVRNTH